MANMRMAKNSSKPICSSGTIAFIMDFRTICRPKKTFKKIYISIKHKH